MANARFDENSKTTIIGVSSVDGSTPINIKVNATTGAMLAEVSGVSLDATGLATEAKQDDIITAIGGISAGSGVAAYSDSGGTDRKGLVDGDRHVQTDVLSSALPTGAATEAKQDTIIGHVDGIEGLLTTIDGDTGAMVTDLAAIEVLLTTIEGNQLADGHNVTVDNASIAVTGTFWQATQPVSGTVTANLSATDNAVLDTIDAVLDTINAKLVSGTDIGDVTINNASGASAVNIQDGGNSITVDGTVTANLSATDNAVLDQIELNQDSQTAILTTIDTDTGAMVTDLAAIEVLLTGIDADTNAIKTAVEVIDNAISGSEMQVDVVAALPAGTNAIGNVGIVPRTSGGMSIFRSIDIDESEEDVKTSAGQVFSISAFNHTAAPIFLKFYNATAANVTVGTTTPVLTFTVPANADSDGAGFIWNNEIGFAFDTAISVAATTGIADNDTGAPAANACSVNIGYA